MAELKYWDLLMAMSRGSQKVAMKHLGVDLEFLMAWMRVDYLAGTMASNYMMIGLIDLAKEYERDLKPMRFLT
jgi:type III secretory pathway component EscU